MANIKNVRDMRDLALDLVDQVLSGTIDPEKANSANRLMNTALKAAIAEEHYRQRMGAGSGFFGSNGIGDRKNLGPRFEWDDGKTDSFGSYIGTKLVLQAWKKKGMLHDWKVVLDGTSPVLVGEGADSPGMEAARKNAERCAMNFMEKNPRLEAGDGSGGEYNEQDQEGMWKGMGHG